MTRWASEVSPERVHSEYPRPQMVRMNWQSLNGLWEFAVQDAESGRPDAWEGQILVPFALESALSGVKRSLTDREYLWYRRSFQVPEAWRGQQVLLHFEAVDWEATVWVNG